MVRAVILADLSPALGPLLVAAWLLAFAGFEKLERPAPTALALARAGLRVPDWCVRVLGVVEVALAVAAGALGGPAGWAVAGLYLGFAAFTTRQVLQARATGEAADCGCFGDSAAPVGWSHVALNLALAAAGGLAGVVGADGIGGGRGAAVASAATVLLALVAATGTRALLTDLPAVRALGRATPSSES